MRLFCCICKRHVEIDAPEKEARARFKACGHDDTKVRRLARGPVGVYKTAAQLAREHDEAARAKAARALEEVGHG